MECGTKLTAGESAKQQQSVPSPIRREAERRQVTAMFCDLVGSTALSERLDPEKYSAMVSIYQQLCKDVINQYDGEIHDFLGDGVVTFFGFPIAHEDDALRSVQCALSTIHRISEANQSRKEKGLELFSVRIGIHTGMVIAGKIVGRKQVLGKTPNIAARLEGLADENSVVISPATFKLVKGYFEVESMGSFTLKGISANLEVYKVLRSSGKSHRLHFVPEEELSPFVGRDQEVDFILDLWKDLKIGKGKAILIKGDAGIGKSRLVHYIKEYLVNQSNIEVLEIQTSSMLTNSTLYPLIELLNNYLQQQIGEVNAGFDLEDLQLAFEEFHFDEDHLVVLADLVSATFPAEFERPYLSATKQKQIGFDILTQFVLHRAVQKPLLLLFEDLHWADHSTLEWTTSFINQISTHQIFTLFTTRPVIEYPEWMNKLEVTHLTLSPLDKNAVQAICHFKCRGIQLPAELFARLAQKTDGIPLYVEEFTSDILESGSLQEQDGHYVLTKGVAKLKIPATLQDSLASRLDRNPREKVVAQLGAILGREFSFKVLLEVSGINEELLMQSLDRLKESEILYVKGIGKESRYTFKHALIQDAAYDSLLNEDRKAWHQKVAKAIEFKYPHISQSQPELVAHHLMGAEEFAQAIPKWMQAGQMAMQKSASVEAVQYFEKALELIKERLDSSNWVVEEIQVLLNLSGLYSNTKAWMDPATEYCRNRAYELSRQTGSSSSLVFANCGMIAQAGLTCDFEKAVNLSGILFATAKETRDETHLFLANTFRSMLDTFRGEYKNALECIDKASDLYDAEKHASLNVLGLGDLYNLNLTWKELILTNTGFIDQAIKVSKELRTRTDQLNHFTTTIVDYTNSCGTYLLRRDQEQIMDLAQIALPLTKEKQELFYISFFKFFYAIAHLLQGQKTFLNMAMEGLHFQKIAGNRYATALLGNFLAEYLIDQNKLEEVPTVLEEGNKLLKELDSKLSIAEETCRILGKYHLKLKAPVKAEALFKKAISMARTKQAKLFELRASNDLARIWIEQGKLKEAKNLLSNIYNWFTEGFDSVDLKETRNLLSELEARL